MRIRILYSIGAAIIIFIDLFFIKRLIESAFMSSKQWKPDPSFISNIEIIFMDIMDAVKDLESAENKEWRQACQYILKHIDYLHVQYINQRSDCAGRYPLEVCHKFLTSTFFNTGRKLFTHYEYCK